MGTAGSAGNNIDITYTAAGQIDKGQLVVQVPNNFPIPAKDADGNVSVSILSQSAGVNISTAPAFVDADKNGAVWPKAYFDVASMSGGSSVTFRYTGTARDVINEINTDQVSNSTIAVYSKGSDLNADNNGVTQTGVDPEQVFGGQVTVATTFAVDGSGAAKFLNGIGGEEKDTLTSRVKTLLNAANSPTGSD